MVQILYTKSACLGLLDSLAHLKSALAKRLVILQEQEIHIQSDLASTQQLDGFLDFFSEILQERITELDKETQ